jgi:hypothetical protein
MRIAPYSMLVLFFVAFAGCSAPSPDQKLKSAKEALSYSRPDLADNRLNEILEKYPGSEQANEARRILDSIKAEKEKRQIKIDMAIGAMEKKADEFTDLVFYSDSLIDDLVKRDLMQLYIKMEKGKYTELHFQIIHYDDKYQDISIARVKTDTAVYSWFPMEPLERLSAHTTYAVIWDEQLNPSVYEELMDVIHSKVAKIRLEGKSFQYAREITDHEKEAFKRVLLAYEGLKQGDYINYGK